MGQYNVNPNPGNVPPGEGSRTAVANNLTWAIGAVLIIAAIAIAIVYVVHNVHA